MQTLYNHDSFENWKFNHKNNLNITRKKLEPVDLDIYKS